MRRAWPLLILAALAGGGCGQKGPLYLPDKGGKVVTSAPAAPQVQAPPAATPPANAPPAETAPANPAQPKPTDKDKDQDQSSPPK
jgi:predicted small lipoprotein YifL